MALSMQVGMLLQGVVLGLLSSWGLWLFLVPRLWPAKHPEPWLHKTIQHPKP